VSHNITCKKCLIPKKSDEFYKSNLSTCKECIKTKSKLQRDLLISTPEGIEKERARHRDKYHRLGYKDVYKPSSERKAEIIKNYKGKYPEKYKAKCASQDLKKTYSENELHHWSYNQDHWKDCIELSVSDHNTIHRFLVYDKESFYYKDLDGNLLDTKEKHLDYIKKQNITIYNN
jgi:hypothetical protein